MKRLRVITGGLALLVVWTLGVYVLGFRQGWYYMALSDSVPRGTLAVGQIGGLNAGKTDVVLLDLEGYVDAGLLAGAEIEAGLGFARLDVLSGHDLARQQQDYLRRLAVYRKRVASPAKYARAGDQISNSGDKALGTAIRKSDDVLRRMVEQHAP